MKKLLSVLISLCMVLAVLPAGLFVAAEEISYAEQRTNVTPQGGGELAGENKGYATWYGGVTNGVSDAAWLKSLAAEASPDSWWINFDMVPESTTYTYNSSSNSYTTDRWNKGVLAKAMSFNDYKATTLQKTTYETVNGETKLDDKGNPVVKSISNTLSGIQNAVNFYSGSTVYGYDSMGAFTYTRGSAGEKSYASHLRNPYKYTQLIYTFSEGTKISDILFGGQYNTPYLRPSNYELYAADSYASLFSSENLLYHFENDYTGGIAAAGSTDTFMQHYHFESLTAKYVGVRILDPMSAFNDSGTAGYNSIRLSALSIYGIPSETENTEETAKYVSVAQPETNIVGDIALIRDVNSSAELSEMLGAECLPSTAIFTIDSSLSVLDTSGSAFSTVNAVIEALNYRVLPVFRISDTASADSLLALLKELNFYDVMVMSDSKEVLKYAREKNSVIRGALDLTKAYTKELTDSDIAEITATASKYMATVVVLPSAVCSKETTAKLWKRYVRVWNVGGDTSSAAENYELLLSGALGVVSDNTSELLDIAKNKLNKNTVTRSPLNIGHRGIPSISPENTVAGAITAWENGADAVEIDLYLTSDGEVILTHDATTGKTCDQNLTVKSSTLEQLKAINLVKNNNGVTFSTPYKLSTLEEMLAGVKEKTDLILALELKDSDALDRAMELVYQYGMTDRCYLLINDIDKSSLSAARSKYPEITVAYSGQDYYNGGLLPKGGEDKGVKDILANTGAYNAVYSPKYDYYGRSSNRAAQLRGVVLTPWTLTTKLQHHQYYLWGYAATLSDNCDFMKEYPKALTITNIKDGDYVAESTTLKIESEIEGYAESFSATPTLEILEGKEIASASGNNITFSGKGEVTFVAKATVGINATSVTVYSNPITVISEVLPLLSVTEKSGKELPSGLTAVANPVTNENIKISYGKMSRSSEDAAWSTTAITLQGGEEPLGNQQVNDEVRTGPSSSCTDFLVSKTDNGDGTYNYNWCLDGTLRGQYIVYDLGDLYDVDTIAFVSSHSGYGMTGAYELYASATTGNITEMDLLTSYRNENANQSQHFKVRDGKLLRARYVGIKFLNPFSLNHTADSTAITNMCARIAEFQVYGTPTPESAKPKFQISEYSGKSLPEGLTAVADPSVNNALSVGYYKYSRASETAAWTRGSFGVQGTATAINDNAVSGSEEFRTGATACTDFLVSKETVDGATKYNYCLDGSLRFQYIVYDLGNLYDIDAIAFVSSHASNRMTGAYELYGSETSDKFEDMEKLAEYQNVNNNMTQIFTTINGRTCRYRYVALRILNPYSLTNSAETMSTYTGLQARIAEFQVYGKKAETIKVDFTDNAGNVVYTVGGNYFVTVSEEQLAEAQAALPLVFGYEFVGWNDAADNVTESKIIKAIYAKNTLDKYSVSVTDTENSYEGWHSFDARLTATATGDGFSYWKDTASSTAISDSAAYTFYVPGNIALESVYNDSETVAKPVVLNSSVQMLQRNDGSYNLYFTGDIKLPEGGVLTEVGITYTNSEASKDMLETTESDTENSIAVNAYSEKLKQGSIMVILSGVKAQKQRFAKLYITYTLNGATFTVFSDCTAFANTPE